MEQPILYIREPHQPLRRELARLAEASGWMVVHDGRVPAHVVVWAVDPDGGLPAFERAAIAVPVVVLVERLGPIEAQTWLRAGAMAVLDRTAPAAGVVGAAMAVSHGNLVAPISAMPSLVAGTEPELLTRAELNWFRSIACGATVRDVALAESYSERELYRRLRACYLKLKVSSRSEALVVLAQAGLLAEREESAATVACKVV